MSRCVRKNNTHQTEETAAARTALGEWIGSGAAWDANGPKEIVEALWRLSGDAYRATLEFRKAGNR